MDKQPGMVRYSLTVHFQENGLLHELWQCAPNRVLVKCVARATGEMWRPSQESPESYLARYFDRQSLRILDPVEALPESPFERKPRGIDLLIEAKRQEENPVISARWKHMRAAILERDGYTCQHCGATNVALHIDHVKPRYLWPELTWNETNITTLCKPCHGEKTASDYRRCDPRTSTPERGRIRRKTDRIAMRTGTNA